MREPRFTEARDRERPNQATAEQIEKARADGRRVAEGPPDASLLAPTRDALASQPPGYWEVFYDAFVSAVRATPERHKAWVDVLAKALATERDALATGLGGNFELPAWMTLAFDLLLQRPDGLRIALGYLGYLSREHLRGSSRPHDGNERWTASSAALDALIATLRQASVSVRQVREAWEAAEQRAVDKEKEDAKRIRVRRRSSGKTSDREGEGARSLHATLGRRDVPPICFILDEYDLLFEGYGGEPAVAGVEQIFALLRGLGQTHGRLSLALIGRDPAFVDQPHLNGFTNPLLGWVEPFHLGPLSDHDATDLLQRLGKRVGLEIGPATVELARRWTGDHPLLLREFGAALYEVAHAASAALPISTEPLHEQAVPVFLQRDAVHTICGEIEALLETRFPEALALLRAMAGAPEEAVRVPLERHGSAGGRAARVLFDFGLLRGEAEAPWLPLLYRDHFGSIVLAPKKLQRSQSHGR